MRYSRPDHCLSFELLRFVRDEKPQKEDLLQWLGPNKAGMFYVLIKAELLEIDEHGLVSLSKEHLSEDGEHFYWERRTYHIDRGLISFGRMSRAPET